MMMPEGRCGCYAGLAAVPAFAEDMEASGLLLLGSLRYAKGGGSGTALGRLQSSVAALAGGVHHAASGL